MATLNFTISFTTQSGQRRRIKTGTQLSVLGEVIKDQYISKAKTETQTVMSSSMAGSTFSSLRDLIQSVAITFQRIVARTPIDESYKTTYKQTGKVKKNKKKPKEEVVEHKPDNDTLRDDWICHLTIDSMEITIRSTDYDKKIFEKINDEKSAQVILNDIIDKLSKLSNVNIDDKKLEIPVHVNFENNNGHFAKIEYGYGGVTSSHAIVKGDKRPHGLIKGFSVQAPSGFFRISMIEFGQIMAVKGRRSVAQRLTKKCYDLSKSHKFFMNKMGYLRTSSQSRLKDTFQHIDQDWSANFNDLWKVAIKSEDIKSEMRKFDEERFKIRSLPDNYYDRLYDQEIKDYFINEEMEDLNALQEELGRLQKQLDYRRDKGFGETDILRGRINEIHREINDILETGVLDRVKALKKNKVTQEMRETYEYVNQTKSKHGRDYLSEDENAYFITKYARKNTVSERTLNQLKNDVLATYDETHKESKPIITDIKAFHEKAFEVGKLRFEEMQFDRYHRFFDYDGNQIRSLPDDLRKKITGVGISLLKKDEKAMEQFYSKNKKNADERAQLAQQLNEVLAVFRAHRYREEGNEKIPSIVSAAKDIYKDTYKESIDKFVKEQKDIGRQLKKDKQDYETFKNNVFATYNVQGIEIKGNAAYQTYLYQRFESEYRDIICDYNERVQKLNRQREDSLKQYSELRRERIIAIEKNLREKGYGTDRLMGYRGTIHDYSLIMEQIIRPDEHGNNRIVHLRDIAFNEYKMDRIIEINVAKKIMENQLEALYNRNYKALHPSVRTTK